MIPDGLGISLKESSPCTFLARYRSNGGVVVKLLACGARGPGFDSRSRCYDFRDWLSPASNTRYDWKIAKTTYILKTTNQLSAIHITLVINDIKSDRSLSLIYFVHLCCCPLMICHNSNESIFFCKPNTRMMSESVAKELV